MASREVTVKLDLDDVQAYIDATVDKRIGRLALALVRRKAAGHTDISIAEVEAALVDDGEGGAS